MTKKLDKEHLDELQSLRESFAKNSNVLGNIAIELHLLAKQTEMLEEEQNKYLNEFETLRKQESELMQKMRDRYGDGQINLNDGTFTSADGLEQ